MGAENKADLKEWAASGVELGSIPWNKLPDINLYMDQVITLLGEKLSFYECGEYDKLLSSSMINNYVKNGLIEHPEKKKYTKEQISRLIMICILKSVLSIQDIAALLNTGEKTEKLYSGFTNTQTDAMVEVSSQLLFALENGDDLNALALKFAAEANAKRAASRKILEYLGNIEKENKKK